VDWNQIPPDNNTGIQFPVQLDVAGALNDSNAHVLQNTTADLSKSTLTVKTDVSNATSASQTGQATAVITPPGGGVPRVVHKTVTVPAHQTSTVTFAPVTIDHPQIWWPYQLGGQPMYTLSTSVAQQGKNGPSTSETFGIRTVTTSLVGKSAEAPDGVRAYQINGRPLLIRGGGFAEDLFLRYSAGDIARQIALLKNLGINTIRLEGHQFPADFYQQMDRAGILIDAGLQCCDAWQPPSDGSGVTAADYAIMADSALTIGQDLRDHPSVFTFSWSDNPPIAKQESVSLQAFRQADFDVPLVSSAEYNSSPQLGPSGEKEGPYDYVPPAYWYDTSHYDPTDPTRTNVGGSWGLDSEQSAGDTVPTLDSINRFLSPADQADLWQHPDYHQYHANYEDGHGGYAFGELYDFDQALSTRYGPWHDLAGYVEEAQVQDYENTRAQFEAFIDHSTNQPTPATGTIYWQVNKGWPTLLWDLYNNDGDQAGSFFGAQQANQPLHVFYAPDDNTVTLDNLGSTTASGLSVEARVYDTAGKVLDDRTTNGLNLTGLQVRNGVLAPSVPTGGAPRTYFVELLLRHNGSVVDRNVYWESTKPDQVNWPATQGNPQATMSQYADLTGLRSLAPAQVTATAITSPAPGPDGADTTTRVTITNTSTTPAVGFFLRADVRRGNANGTVQPGDNQVTSALWSDNDVTLWPGESETLQAGYDRADLHGASPVVSVSGWNVGTIDVAAPSDQGR
jgi:exo-1,4-beta-D-glucosaminidase